jgi:hypothetical protein
VLCSRSTLIMAAVASSEGDTARPVFVLDLAMAMLRAECSLEAFQEYVLSSEFDVGDNGMGLYGALGLLDKKPVRAWLRSADFAARVGAIEWEDPLRVFFDACKEGDEEYVSRMSEEHPEWLDKGCASHGVPILHAMCHGGLMRFVPVLVALFETADVMDKNDETPLFFACLGGQLEVFEYLLSAGASVGVVTTIGSTMLHAACEGRNLAIVRVLLDMGLDVNARFKGDVSPLQLACQVASLEMVSELVERGADIESCNAFGLTPLSVAFAWGRRDVVKYLLAAGASLLNAHREHEKIENDVFMRDLVVGIELLLEMGISKASKGLIEACIRKGGERRQVLRFLLLHDDSARFVSQLDGLWFPAVDWLRGHKTVSQWRNLERRMDLRRRLLSWRRGFAEWSSVVGPAHAIRRRLTVGDNFLAGSICACF